MDNLPCELPRDASEQFSGALKGYVPELARCDFSQSFEDLRLPPEIKRAIITHHGKLTPGYRYLEEYLIDP